MSTGLSYIYDISSETTSIQKTTAYEKALKLLARSSSFTFILLALKFPPMLTVGGGRGGELIGFKSRQNQFLIMGIVIHP